MLEKYFKHIILPYKNSLIFFFLFFISRIFFINSQGVFFDSQEYIHLLSLPNYFQAIASGHFPPHEGYILLFWPLFQIVNFFSGNSSYAVIVGQICISFLTLYCFYRVIDSLLDHKIAIYAAIIASLLPLFWIINVTLMMENAYAFYFFLSLFLLSSFLLKTKKNYLMHLSLFVLMLAILTQTMVVLWSPIYLFLVYLKKRNLVKKISIFFAIYLLIFCILNVFSLSFILHMSLSDVMYYLYISKRTEFPDFHTNLYSMLAIIRNFFIPLLRNNAILLGILAFLSLAISWKKDKKVFVLGLLFIIPAIYTTQWWDSLLDGRHALLAGFGIALLAAYLLRRKKIVFYLLIIYLLVVSFAALILLRKPIPYLQEASYIATLPKNALMIESHFARPQVQETAKSQVIYVNEPGWEKKRIKAKINDYLARKKPIFISSAALSEPYGLYSGPYVHNITLSYEHPFELQPMLIHYTLSTYKIISKKDNLIIYKIISAKKSPYPSVRRLRDSYRRIDYADPFWQMTWWVETTFFQR